MTRERRRCIRVPFDSKVQVRTGQLLLSCRGVNVSRDGLLIHAPTRLPRVGTIDIVATLPGQSTPLELRGELMRQVSHPTWYSIGIRLVETPTRSDTLLQAHVLDALERNVPANDPAREQSNPELRKKRLERVQRKSAERDHRRCDPSEEGWPLRS